MTQHDINRAALAMYAARAAGPRGSLEQMKAIAFCLRNRVRQGWDEGDWLKVVENADEYLANPAGPLAKLDPDNRSFQRLIRDVDEIYFSRRDFQKDPSGDQMPSLEEAIGKATYWAFIDQPFQPWFLANIVQHPEDHHQKAQMGVMLFFE